MKLILKIERFAIQEDPNTYETHVSVPTVLPSPITDWYVFGSNNYWEKGVLREAQ